MLLFPSESTDSDTSAWHVVVSSKSNDLRDASFVCVSHKSGQYIFGMFFFMDHLTRMQFPFCTFLCCRTGHLLQTAVIHIQMEIHLQHAHICLLMLWRKSCLSLGKKDKLCRRLNPGTLSLDGQKLNAGLFCLYSVCTIKGWVLCRTNMH